VTEWLIDNAESYDRLVLAIRSAQRSVWITQLAFDADCVAHGQDGTRGTVLSETLVALAERRPVDIRILLNATLLLDTATLLRRFFDARAARGGLVGRIRVRGVQHFPDILHLKVVIVDGREALIFGSPFANGYWDDARHAPRDRRRVVRELGGRPVHDVSLGVTGDAAERLAEIFAELWSEATARGWEGPPREVRRLERRVGNGPAPARAPVAPSAPALGAPVPAEAPAPDRAAGRTRVVLTLPRGAVHSRPEGATEILDTLLDGLARARSLIYIEQQYLSSRRVIDALAAALARASELELIVVLNQNPDITAYLRWQNARLAEGGLLSHPRAGVFALWSTAPSSKRPGALDLNQVFVHSKVVVVDDRWATVGTANLDGMSLHSYGDDFNGRVGRRVFRDVRNFEVNVVVRDDPANGARAGSVADLRTRLWSEHLARPAAEFGARPAGGWLPVWRAAAARLVETLGRRAQGGRANGVAGTVGRVLAYSPRATPSAQLAGLGVPLDAAALELCFNPTWLEAHTSPNWIRNMFL